MKNVQLIISIIFGILTVLGLLAFAGILPRPESKTTRLAGRLTMWGTEDRTVMEKFFQQWLTKNYPDVHVSYTQKNPATYANGIIEALAAGEGPDMIILPNELVVRFADKVEPFTPEIYSERQLRDTFLQIGEIFVEPGKDILALPFSTDPMVMYWNRNIFSSNKLVEPPKYWDEFLAIAPTLTKKSEAKDILRSGIAFGEFSNVTHAKDILAMLMLQTGNSLVLRQSTGKYLPVFQGKADKKNPPANEAFRFYTDFADPLNSVYSWNRSLAESKDAFLAGDLAVYFGFASELAELREKNPNLNFDVAVVPQVRDTTNKTTFGRVTGLAVLKTSLKKPLAFFVTQTVSSPEYNQQISATLKTPSPVRAVLAKGTPDPFMKVFYDSAIISKTWLDIRPEKTNEIFKKAVDTIISGKETVSGAVGWVQQDFTVLTE
ncbi:MAG: extracellular solute-binding protein [Candidatus Paceibacterota bacterium]|jgi:ABC-type glycerol-3-phosphate transport system substrate-binding protein